MNNDELESLQLQLEQQSLDKGVEQYRNALKGGEDKMPPGMQLIRSAIEPLSAAIKAFREGAIAGKASRNIGMVKYMMQFDDGFLAFVTVKTMMAKLSSVPSQQGVAMAIAGALEDSINWEQIRKEDPALYSRLLSKLNKKTNTGYRHVIMRRFQNDAGIETIKWGTAEQVRLGGTLMNLALESTGMFEANILSSKRRGGKADTPLIIQPSAKTLEWLEQAHARCELLSPYYLPMVVKPRPWRSPFGGGYLTHRLRFPLIKSANKNYLEEMKSVQMPMVYRSINALQETPWSINKAILAVMKEVWDNGGMAAKLPSRNPKELPPKDFPEDAPNTDPKVMEWKRKAAETYDDNARSIGKRVAMQEKLLVAEQFSAYERFYFPHSLDWRGRAYPSGSLSPQGDDMARGLLQFADGKELGPDGGVWLGIHGANCYGIDKVSFGERFKWVLEHRDEILDSALRPLDGFHFWQKAASPWQFLAFCMEWAGYLMTGNSFKSYLSVSWDGSCNGLQNFSAMLLDEVGGAATNLVPSDVPADVYTRVADESNRISFERAAEGDAMAQKWAGKVTRKLTKRNTMTVPYAVSLYGMREQLVLEFRKMVADAEEALRVATGDDVEKARKELEEVQRYSWSDAIYLAEVNHQAIGNVVIAARAAMDWLKAAAKVAASGGLPVIWTTPSELIVQQNYREDVGKQVRYTVAGRTYYMMIRTTGDRLMASKQAAGISPNFIHSLDAAHMQRTVCYCLDAGITHFAMIHDSYGTHAADAPVLAHQLRKAFVDQYSLPVLENFRDELVRQLPEELSLSIPPLPPQGRLDLAGVLESDYFFA